MKTKKITTPTNPKPSVPQLKIHTESDIKEILSFTEEQIANSYQILSSRVKDKKYKEVHAEYEEKLTIYSFALNTKRYLAKQEKLEAEMLEQEAVA